MTHLREDWVGRTRSGCIIGAFFGVSWLVGYRAGDSATAPPSLSYNGSRPFPAVVGEAIALTPAVSGSIDGYAVSPELPSGLGLNRVTGVISGTPTKARDAAIFTIRANHHDGHSTFPLVLSVTEPPSHLSYPSPAKGIVGTPITPLRPRIAGAAEHYSVTPALPGGVELDGVSGAITGIPATGAQLAPYTVTASSQSGSTSFVLLFAVIDPSPAANH